MKNVSNRGRSVAWVRAFATFAVLLVVLTAVTGLTRRLDVARSLDAILGVRIAEADDDTALARVADFLRAGRSDAAHARLVEVVEADGVRPITLARAAWWALRAADIDVLQRVRAVGERLEIESGKQSALDLALGYAYLGLAENHLKQRTGGSSVALLFADAETRGRDVADAQPASAAWLAARGRHAQGDLEGAIAQIDAYRAAESRGAEEADPSTTELDLLEGRLRYERAAAQPVGSDGRPAAGARADLDTAKACFDRVAQHTERLLPADLQALRLHTAWNAHRLGDVAAAREAYAAAHALDDETAWLARRGLASLYTNDTEGHRQALEALLEDQPGHLDVLDAIVDVERGAGRTEDALLVLQRRLRAAAAAPQGWATGGEIFAGLKQWGEAIRHFEQALRLDASYDRAASGLEAVAQALVPTDFERAVRTYDLLLALRPSDPYARNNLGFILRERVSPFTAFAPGGIQALRPDAPVRIKQLLIRCRDVYAQAVALIPEADDESRELLASWNLAGIVNDYGLMLHYFADIQDPVLAEQMYLRTLRMTDDGFKDTYVPNLQRLYSFVLKDRHLTWYRAARRCKDAILKERRAEGGGLELIPDEARRQAAARDEQGLRARIVRELQTHAEEDGAAWPPEAPAGSNRAGGADR